MFRLFFTLTTVIAIIFAAAWYMSPLGLGFAFRPPDPSIQKIALTTYELSYFVGIPMLLIGQICSAILAASGERRAAFILPLASIALFTVYAVIVLHLFKQI